MSSFEPLEFKECVVDSPRFREKLLLHEKEIENNVKIFKNIYDSIKNVYRTLEDCSTAFEDLSINLLNFISIDETDINNSQAETEDEKMIRCTVKIYSNMIKNVEEMRKRNILGNSKEKVMNDLQQLRDDCLSRSKQDIKEFKKTTATYYTRLERYSAIKYKEDYEYNSVDEDFQKDRLEFVTNALKHVMNIQDTEEKRTTKLVQTLGLMMQMFTAFHHEAYDHFGDEMKRIGEIEDYVSRTLESYTSITTDTKRLMKHMLDRPIEHIQPDSDKAGEVTREGYLFVLVKKQLVSDTWVRKYCIYEKNSKKLLLIQSSQVGLNPTPKTTPEEYHVISCEGKNASLAERRFCFDLKVANQNSVLTLQAVSKEDLKQWLLIMGGKEPIYTISPRQLNPRQLNITINEKAMKLMSMCLSELEKRGLGDEGLYRLSGRKTDRDNLIERIISDINDHSHNCVSAQELESCDINTLASTVKVFISSLKTPLTTYHLYDEFVSIGKLQNVQQRFNVLLQLVPKLPPENYELFVLIMKHLSRVASNSTQNLMTAANLATCFSPIVFQPPEDTVNVTAIRESKFGIDVLSLIIERWDEFFKKLPTNTDRKISFSTAAVSPNTDFCGLKVSDAVHKSFRGIRKDKCSASPREANVKFNFPPENEKALDDLLVWVEDIMVQIKSLSSMNDLKKMFDVSKQLSQQFLACENYQTEIANKLLQLEFPEYAVRIMRRLNNMGVFKNDDIWFSTFYFYDICWNFSTVSFPFASTLAQQGLPSLLILNICFKPYLQKLQSSNVEFIIKASLNIIRNICRYPGNCAFFRADTVKPSLITLLNCEEEKIKTIAAMCLAFLVLEVDDSLLRLPNGAEDKDILREIMNNVKSARAAQRKKYIGFRSSDFLEPIRAATSVECERMHFIEIGGISLLKEILLATKDANDEERVECLQIICNICGSRELTSKLLNDGIDGKVIEPFVRSANINVSCAAQNVLWRFELNKPLPTKLIPMDKINPSSVYISYADVNRTIIMKLQARLIDTGLINIMEPDNRLEVDSVKKTIRNCALVVICLSESFKSVPRYQLEVEYCDRLSKPIVSILIQQKYRPDGWLQRVLDRGLTLFNLSSRIDFDTNWELFVSSIIGQFNEINKTLTTHERYCGAKESCDNVHEPVSTTVDEDSIVVNYLDSHRVSVGETMLSDSGPWLEQHGLRHLRNQFTWIDMNTLKYFQNMKKNAHDYFYQTLEKQLKLDLIDILKFGYAIDDL